MLRRGKNLGHTWGFKKGHIPWNKSATPKPHRPNIVVECDGEYWHRYPEGLPLDKARTAEMEVAGYKVIRLWGKQIEAMTAPQLAEILDIQ